MARDYTTELLPAAETFAFCDEYRRTIRTVLITVQALLKPTYRAGANAVGFAIEYLDWACAYDSTESVMKR